MNWGPCFGRPYDKSLTISGLHWAPDFWKLPSEVWASILEVAHTSLCHKGLVILNSALMLGTIGSAFEWYSKHMGIALKWLRPVGALHILGTAI